jgi:Na+/H+ ion antiporter subunit
MPRMRSTPWNCSSLARSQPACDSSRSPRTAPPQAITGLLAGLSPGSMLVEVDPERQAMLFHVIDAHDPDAVRDHLDRFYQRYQRRVFP